MSFNRRILLNIANLKGISVMRLANENDISQANLSRWFKGQKGGYVKEEKIERMAQYLGVDYKTGKFLPGVHRWKVITYKGIPLVPTLIIPTLSSLSPGGGDLVLIGTTIPRDLLAEQEMAFDVVINGGKHLAYIVAIPYDRSFRLIIDIASPMAFSHIREELKKTNNSWKFKKNKEGQFVNVTFEADEKEIINHFENNSLSVEELDRILVIEESQWTWDRLVAVLKGQGKFPEEVAQELGLVERENR